MALLGDGAPRSPYPALLGLALAALGAGAPARAQDTLETEVRAAYVYKFAPYVTWPASAMAGEAFSICLVGGDPFAGVLDRAVAGQRVGARPILVRRMAQASRDDACQVAVLSGPPHVQRDALRLLHGAPVLTITQASESPGIIDLKVVAGRVRFSIDEAAAVDNSLSISSRLLGLALSVKPAAPQGSSR